MQIANKYIYIYNPNLLFIVLWLEPVISFCVFFFRSLNPSTTTFCQVIAAARQAGGLALERQVWDPVPCRESFSSQGTDVLKIDVQQMCYILYTYIMYVLHISWEGPKIHEAVSWLDVERELVDWLVCCEESQF